VTDKQALEAFFQLSKLEGIIPALESAHAVAYIMEHAKDFSRDDHVVICLSGRGDKDVQQVADMQGGAKG
jgi:tryptophan synthase beta chain